MRGGREKGRIEDDEEEKGKSGMRGK